MTIRDNIINTIKQLEEENDINILLAIESGSRAWGFSSPDSDYDCRFIFAYNKDKYLDIDTIKDYIERPVDKIYDVNGWDIKKALKAIKKNNPTIFEWIQSPIIYKELEGFKEEMLQIAQGYYDKVPVLYHYLSTAKKKIENIENNDKSKLKAYFYVLRALLSCKYSIYNKEIPPMELQKLIEGCDLDSEVIGEIHKLLQIKKKVDESYLIQKNQLIIEFCKGIIKETDEFLQNNKKKYDNSSQELNEFFRKVLDRNA